MTLKMAKLLKRPLPEKQRGQSLVELALTLPLLILIMAGVLDLGRVFFAYITITNAAREGARYGADHPRNPDDLPLPSGNGIGDIQDKVIAEATGSGINISAGNITITCKHLGSPVTCGTGTAPGDLITVNVTYTFNLVTVLVLTGTPVTLKSSATMTILTD
jgi:Flp pilus assembly protein TadG